MEKMDCEETPKKESLEERQEREARRKIEKISEMRSIDDGIFGYVYRVAADRTQVALPPIHSVMEDNDIGLEYGPGKYRVIYFREDSNGVRKAITTMHYNIGREYLELHRDYCRQNGKNCAFDSGLDSTGSNLRGGGLAELLDPKKMQAASGFLAALKMILSPDNNDKNYKYIMEQNAALIQAAFNGRSQGPSDIIVSKAMEILSKPARQEHETFEDKLESLGRLQAMAGRLIPTAPAAPAEYEDEKLGPMEKLINMAMDALPAFLESHNGNVKAAAQAAQAKNKVTAAILRGSPGLQAQFYTSMVSRFGAAQADQWAAAYGIQRPQNTIPFQAPAPAAQNFNEIPAQARKVVF